MKPKVSIVIPVYNVEKFLQACIDSLINQKLEEIEFIFINDASPDNCLQILKKNEEKYPDKIRVIDSKKNLCQGGARNLGIQAARGEYIGFVDSDDMVLPEMFSKLYECAEKINADATFIQYSAIESKEGIEEDFNFSQERIPIIKWSNKLLKLEGKCLNDLERADLMAYPIGGIWCGLWRKNVIIENNIFFPERLRYEDNYWVNLIKCYISKVAFIQEVGYLYRKNENSTVNSKNELYQFDRIKIEKMTLEEIKRRDFFERYFSAWEYIYTFRYAFNSWFMFFYRFDKPPISEMTELMRDLKRTFPDWEKNKYYLELTSYKDRIKNKIIATFPRIALRIYSLKK